MCDAIGPLSQAAVELMARLRGLRIAILDGGIFSPHHERNSEVRRDPQRHGENRQMHRNSRAAETLEGLDHEPRFDPGVDLPVNVIDAERN